jgi:ABC-type branched-subunit amino acid transport system substrate-binding protein
LDKAQTRAAIGGGGGGGGGAAQSTAGATDSGAGGPTATVATGAQGSTSGATGGSGGSGGSSGSGGGTGGPSAAQSGGSGCSAVAGTKAPGLSDTEIKFGNISTITGPVPDFGQTGRAGAKAYFDYINATQGGVCGRKLSLVTADDRLDTATNRAAAQQLMGQVFGFAGNTTVVDNGSASVLGGTDIPVCALTIGDASATMSNGFSPNPVNVASHSNGTVAMWRYLKSTYHITKVAVMTPAQNDARERSIGYINDAQAAGLQTMTLEAPITETNYTGYVSKMQSGGADALITTLEVNGMAKLARAVQANPTFVKQLKVPFYGAQAYGQQFLKLAGDAANGTIIGINYDIIEGGTAATQTFAQWYARSAPGRDADFFALMGWTAAELCVQGLKAAGGAPTRAKVTNALKGIHHYTAGGILTDRDPANKTTSQAFAVVGVKNGKWVHLYPASGFANG